MGSNSPIPTAAKPHVVLFPFMSKGHTIPILHLARHFLHRQLTVTLITTPANSPFITQSLSNTDANVVIIPFPENSIIPAGVESTDKLPSMSLLVPFVNTTKLVQHEFERTLESLVSVSFLVSDGFLGWTVESAAKFGIPCLVLNGMNAYSMTLTTDIFMSQLVSKMESADEPFTVPSFPWIKVTRNDLSSPFCDRDPSGPHMDFIIEQAIATSKSYGLLINSFYELEPSFVDYWNHRHQPRAYCIGPLCLTQSNSAPAESNRIEPHCRLKWMQWLDEKLEQGCNVLYVAFGSQAEFSKEQFKEIAIGLENSKAKFLWVVRDRGLELEEGFEERVKERGMIVKEWVNQGEILSHESVKGFLSHCGWNSVLESISACVPILAWPLANEQHLNARMVVEEIKIGLRVETCDGSVNGFVKSQGLEKMVVELMEGGEGKKVRKRVEEVREMAVKAVEEGGSSCKTLDQLLDELCNKRIHA